MHHLPGALCISLHYLFFFNIWCCVSLYDSLDEKYTTEKKLKMKKKRPKEIF